MITDLRKNVNYQILKNDGEVSLSGSDGTGVCSYSVTGGEDSGVVAYCDERVQLYDGKMLVRLRNTLSVCEA